MEVEDKRKKLMGFVVAMAVMLALIPILKKEAQMSERETVTEEAAIEAEAVEAISAEIALELFDLQALLHVERFWELEEFRQAGFEDALEIPLPLVIESILLVR